MSNRKFAPVIIVLSVIAVGSVLFGLWYINSRNNLVRMEQQLEASWSEVDNQLQRRFDLIPNLVETVRGYASHEEAVFTQIAEARAKLGGARGVEETAAAYGEMESALSRLLVVVEQYPNLKADQSFIRLQDELAGTENRLAVARRRYNETVMSFNQAILVFPANIVAGSLGLTRRPYFEIEESARTAPQVRF